MIECVFTIDYEIYGNGEGRLEDLVYAPTERLREMFKKHGVRFVPFVEAAELEIIEQHGTDPAIAQVGRQIREMHRDGCTPALHLHPQWYNARRVNDRWVLDYTEYNLCVLSRPRIVEIVDRSIGYLRRVTGAADFSPIAFRAGNWLFQPSRTAGEVLAERGVKIDSSVFKGGVRHEHGLDYRRAISNGYFWRFTDQADVPDEPGTLLELPIYTRMTPFWNMTSTKRLTMEKQNASAKRTNVERYYRLQDLIRFWHPLKFDFCRMTLDELTGMVDRVIAEDRLDAGAVRPLVAIGHTKELSDLATIDAFLSYLRAKNIAVSTFEDVYEHCA